MSDQDDDSNWSSAFGCAGLDARLIATIERRRAGENDGDHWLCVGTLTDGRWFSLTAWCDYTGWGCQDGGEHYVDATRDGALKQLTIEEQVDLEQRGADGWWPRESHADCRDHPTLGQACTADAYTKARVG